MPIAEIYGGISAFKAMFDMAKGLKDASNASDRNAAVIELQEKILGAQSAHAALLQRIGELEEKVRGFEDWETEKNRYELKDLGWGSLAYMLKPNMRGTEPPHWVCPNCLSNKKISLITYMQLDGIGNRYICWPCSFQINPSQTALQPGTNNPRWLDDAA